MSIVFSNNIKDLMSITNKKIQLLVIERKSPANATSFFNLLKEIKFTVVGEIRKNNAFFDVKGLINDLIPKHIQDHNFYEMWVKDMANICVNFCDIEKAPYISIWLGTKRGCKRYHIDNVPRRLLVTYSGIGTEWIPDEYADKEAFEKGKTNEYIVKESFYKRYMNEWDIAIFKGGKSGLLHRTPDAASYSYSILMRLDHKNYWKNIYENIS